MVTMVMMTAMDAVAAVVGVAKRDHQQPTCVSVSVRRCVKGFQNIERERRMLKSELQFCGGTGERGERVENVCPNAVYVRC